MSRLSTREMDLQKMKKAEIHLFNSNGKLEPTMEYFAVKRSDGSVLVDIRKISKGKVPDAKFDPDMAPGTPLLAKVVSGVSPTPEN